MNAETILTRGAEDLAETLLVHADEAESTDRVTVILGILRVLDARNPRVAEQVNRESQAGIDAGLSPRDALRSALVLWAREALESGRIARRPPSPAGLGTFDASAAIGLLTSGVEAATSIANSVTSTVANIRNLRQTLRGGGSSSSSDDSEEEQRREEEERRRVEERQARERREQEERRRQEERQRLQVRQVVMPNLRLNLQNQPQSQPQNQRSAGGMPSWVLPVGAVVAAVLIARGRK